MNPLLLATLVPVAWAWVSLLGCWLRWRTGDREVMRPQLEAYLVGALVGTVVSFLVLLFLALSLHPGEPR